jgi:hypothetical protein
MLAAWVNAEVPVAMAIGGDRKMVPPVVMASATWGTTGGGNHDPVAVTTPQRDQGSTLNVAAPGVLGNDSVRTAIRSPRAS